ncbi:MAG: MBL fold metallo-hydrolase [Actinobacteria bacterium]|nr:MBL fold metallo-hydrolase [Actinomycetota bacterium]
MDLAPVDRVRITTLVDNVIDVWMPDQGPAERLRDHGSAIQIPTSVLEAGVVDDQPRAEHGFSALVSVTVGDDQTHVLFDAGRTPDGLIHNMRCLGIDPGDIAAVVLSHGHFDHTTGIDGFIRGVGRSNLPVIIHPHFWNRRRILLPGREPWELPTTSRSALEGAGFDIVEQRQPSFLLDGCLLVTGEVDRTNDFEPGFPLQEAWSGGSWEPDPLVLDDQALLLNVRGRGLVVMTGCGHAGIVNTIAYARRLTGIQQVHGVVGGFHLNGPLFEPLIPRVCDAFAQVAPDVIVPAHCTGWRAIHALAARFPEAFVPNSVGTTFEFGPEPGRSD